MAGEDIIMMSQRELRRLHVVHKVLDKKLKQTEVIDIIGLSDRQIRRVVKRVREEGDKGIVHRLRGRASNRAIPKKIKDRVICLYSDRYKGFGPTLASEKLFEIDKIKISDETLRNWLIECKEWKKIRKGRTYRRWRERKFHFGEMIQVDGSHHDWFEGRGAECVLMGYIDDATGTVFARFYEYEGTLPAMDSFKRYIKQYGLPNSVYIDKHTTYKSTAKPSIEDELNNREPLSQFGRGLKELGVDVIYANSPQAKGRIERLFRTFQDRLIKEMRLRGIKTIEEANKFLKYYLSKYNKRFSVIPLKKANLHRSIPQNIDIDLILCIKTERGVRNDFTIAHNKKLYQILEHTMAKRVIVEEKTNGRMFITYKGERLKYKEISNRPKKQDKPKESYVFKLKKVNIPSADHPWRKFLLNSYSHLDDKKRKEKEAKRKEKMSTSP